MTKLQFILILIAVFAGSILGGAAVQSFNPQTDQADNNRVLTCNKLVVQDKNGHDAIVIDASGPKQTVGIFLKNDTGHESALTSRGIEILSPEKDIESLYSAYGAVIIYNRVPVFACGVGNKAFIHINNNNGNIIWSAP